MQDVIEKFKKYLLVNNRSQNTIISYINKLNDILKVIDVNNITQDNIDDFFISIKDKYEGSTMNVYRSIVSSLLKFLNKDFKLPKKYKETKREKLIITEEELEKVLDEIIDSEFSNSLKIKTLINFMFYTGTRRGDICKLKREHFDLPNKRVKVGMTKSKIETYVCFTTKVQHLLESYFASEEETSNAFNIKYSYFQEIFDRINQYFRNKHLHPHLLRHSFGSHSIKSGINMENVKDSMGHADIKTTAIYTHTTFADREKEYHEKIG